ncbi:MAG: hypothetical protein J5I90_22115 [Caldilineales bacterium]|nr:hypothetical protein [Caldilineales bacterium]
MTNKHLFLMLAGCLIPLAALAAIYVFGLSTNIVLLAVLLLFCPLSHFLMMKFMMDEHRSPRTVRNHRESAQN